mmetsp:Transcript_43642/g.107426  ORF Transcript_43642/g.107426 Transcript_43642/m.107426 type:complete len:86 (+) Transcript_43642:402-659(+)
MSAPPPTTTSVASSPSAGRPGFGQGTATATGGGQWNPASPGGGQGNPSSPGGGQGMAPSEASSNPGVGLAVGVLLLSLSAGLLSQ